MVERLRPREELLKVVETINDNLELTGMHIELASDKRSKEMVDLLALHFFPDETICKSLGIVIDENMKQVLLARYKDNLSLLLVSDASDEVIGARTIKIETVKEESLNLNAIEDKNIRTAINFLHHKNAEMDVYKYFGVDCAVHFINLVVHKDYRNKGLASVLMKGALQFVRDIGLETVCISGEGTSKYSQRIYEKFGFEILHTVKYEEYKEDGEVVIKNTGDNKTCKFYVKKL